jgi:protein TonB
MFEHSMMPTTRNKPWTLGASITLQSAIVGSMALYSALHVEMLPLTMRHLELPMPPVPKPEFVKVISTFIERQAGGLTAPVRMFAEPIRIPDGVPQINDLTSEAPSLAYSSNTAADEGLGVVGVPGVHFIGANSTVVPKPPPAHAPIAKPSGPTRIGGVVMDAKIIKRVIPLYPPLAKNARISGKVHLMGIIAKDGTIQKLEVLDGHPLLVLAALEAVKQWIYRPTHLNGEPVDVITPIEVNFTLTQ